ncbi:Uncharacterised protein [Salmonella enterica subsp. enterica serovar Typhi]|nr:Uncharacterised protein [Salmonella enterica subsp. enterica serovar Typhi]CQW40425.1 Uncharacterised protein [Salmonella enterica subsp. enterica serovar Typhi]
MRFRWRQALRRAVIQLRVIKLTRLTGLIVVLHGMGKAFGIQPQLAGQFTQRIGLCAGENRRHKVTDRFAVDNGVANLPRLLGNQTPPDGIAFRPEIFAFIVKALRVPVDYHTK